MEWKKLIFAAVVFCGVGAFAAEAEDLVLDGDWTLSYRPARTEKTWLTVPARVPGEVNLDLVRAGVLPDPEIGTNVYAHLALEANEWRYERRFPKAVAEPGERLVLRFDGVDTVARYFLNGEELGSSVNMFIPVEFDVTGKLRDENTLRVDLAPVVSSAPLGALGGWRELAGSDGDLVRKAQHSFGWDIMPRLVTFGIWKGVRIERRAPERFTDMHFFTMTADVRRGCAEVGVTCRLEVPLTRLHCAKYRFVLIRNGVCAAKIEHPLHALRTQDRFVVKNVAFWWPRDAGAPALYDAVAELLDEDGRPLARLSRKVGIRTVELERVEWRSEVEPGTFRFLVNGEPIYMHGCNVTPMDALHSRDPQHLKRCCDMLVDLNCNMVRSWGGGVYESEQFFDFCDEHGILVWQDFGLANAYPSQSDGFAAVIESEARQVVERLRGHASLALWSGNNEIDRNTKDKWRKHAPDPDVERVSRHILPEVLRECDPFTSYLPSSPVWTKDTKSEIRGADAPYENAMLSQDHLWGPRRLYFKGSYWTNAPATFVSETGVHGCPSVESLKRMMTPEGLSPWVDDGDRRTFNSEWCCKSTVPYPDLEETRGRRRNELMTEQVRRFFGSVPENLETFSDASQIYQAEALRCWAGTFRCRKGRTWGMLWWNLRDGWPIISDAVVDYYFNRKRAYEVLKSIQQPQLVQLCDGAVRGLMAVNDRLYPVKGRVTATDVDSGRTLYDEEVTLSANAAVKLAEYPESLTGQGLVRIVYSFEGVSRENRCLYGEPPFDYGKVCGWLSNGMAGDRK